MAGIAGALIGLATGAQSAIAGVQALLDATTTGRGCTTNFVGFGLDCTNQVQSNDIGVIEDYDAVDDLVVLGIDAGGEYVPTYTADVLSWDVVVVP